MANKKVNQLTSKPAVNLTDLFLIADPTSGQAFKTTISDLGTAIGSGVSSVNTLVGAVVLDTDDIQELASPTNRWFTDTRARAALSAGTGISYDSGTGVITNAVTSGQIATALGYTPADGANYLPLAGGTMGGAIFGTIATFASSTSVTALGITLSGASGDGVKINHSAGRAFNIQSSGGGFGILINNETASTSAPFTIQKQGLAVITLTDAGAGSFASSLTANSFIKSGGTSSQFLKADGSVDSSTYLTTGTAASTYLPLTGGTLTGGLNGTFGNFSSYVNAQTIDLSNSSANNALRITHTNTSYHAVSITATGGSALYATGSVSVIGTLLATGVISAQSGLSNGTGQSFALPTASGTLALTSDLSSYLPLSGGTLTGALSGTSATFSSWILTSNNLFTGGNNTGVFLTGSSSDFSWGLNRETAGLTLYAGSAVSPKMTITSSGNVGIGTTAPFNPGGGGQTSLEMSGSSYSTIFLSANSATVRGQFTADNLNSWVEMGARTNHPLLFLTNNSERMRITSSGNVGIGVTSTGDKLEVFSGASRAVQKFSTSTNGLYTTYASAAGAAGYIGNGQGILSSAIESDFAIRSEAALLFAAGGNTERMRITAGGFLKASNNGTYLNAGAYHEMRQTGSDANIAVFTNTSASPYGPNIYFTSATPNNTTNYFLTGGDNTNDKFFIYSNGSMVNRTGTYGTISDIKYKENIVDATSKLEDISKLKVRNFNFKGDSTKQLGFIAQEFEEVFPNMVDISKESGENGETYKSIKTSILVPMLVKAVQELKAELDTLKNK